ncbi:MAG: M23 family metallopeptidase [Anaerolineales bacterium]|nr:M23 family metallopeptidase [Anaerolineales bacterium]
MKYRPSYISPEKEKPKRWLLFVGLLGGIILLVFGYLAYRYFFSSTSSDRWQKYLGWKNNQNIIDSFLIPAGTVCEDGVFAFPTDGVVFGLWKESYRVGHVHAGIDIFPPTGAGETPVFVAYPGYLSRSEGWKSSVIIRIPDDPLHPGRQIWTYYTHMADVNGNSFISDEFPPGTNEVFVEAGAFLGYVGNFSGTLGSPTGIHLHFSIVMDDGTGGYLNELEVKNTYDPSPYFALALNNEINKDDFPFCKIISEEFDWLVKEDGLE